MSAYLRFLGGCFGTGNGFLMLGLTALAPTLTCQTSEKKPVQYGPSILQIAHDCFRRLLHSLLQRFAEVGHQLGQRLAHYCGLTMTSKLIGLSPR